MFAMRSERNRGAALLGLARLPALAAELVGKRVRFPATVGGEPSAYRCVCCRACSGGFFWPGSTMLTW